MLLNSTCLYDKDRNRIYHKLNHPKMIHFNTKFCDWFYFLTAVCFFIFTGMPGTVNKNFDPIFTSNQDNFSRKRSNNRNNILWKHHPTQPGPGFIPSNVKQSTSFPAHIEKTSSNLYFAEWKPKEICDKICNRNLSYLWFTGDYDQTIFDYSKLKAFYLKLRVKFVIFMSLNFVILFQLKLFSGTQYK